MVETLPVQLNGSRVACALMRLAGWRVRFGGLPGRQGVLIVYPHTSNWDFFVGIFAKWTIGIEVTFWGKDTLFRVPLFGKWLRWLGGVPVDRAAPHGIVGQMAQALIDARVRNQFLWLALTPEGTRKYRAAWRSGFYHVAMRASVPLGLVCFDYRRREVGIANFLQLSGDAALDMANINAILGTCTGCNPALAAPIRLEHPQADDIRRPPPGLQARWPSPATRERAGAHSVRAQPPEGDEQSGKATFAHERPKDAALRRPSPEGIKESGGATFPCEA